MAKDILKQLKVKKGFKPGELLQARAKMSKAYLAKEKTEKHTTKAEKLHEKKESKVHEVAEHLTAKQVKGLKNKKVTKDLINKIKVII